MALEAYLIKPHSYVGLTCTAFQRREAGTLGARPVALGQDPSPEPEPLADQQLRFRCTTGRPNISLSSFHIKVGTGAGRLLRGEVPGCRCLVGVDSVRGGRTQKRGEGRQEEGPGRHQSPSGSGCF